MFLSVEDLLCLSSMMGHREPTLDLHHDSYFITGTDSTVNDDSCFVPGSVPIMHQFKIT